MATLSSIMKILLQNMIGINILTENVFWGNVEAMMRRRDRKFGMQNDILDEREIEAYYRDRYNEDTAAIARFGEGGEEMSDEITQQTLLPEVKDPNLWMVKCRIGEEKTTVLQLMRKMIAYQHEEEPLQIR